MISYLFLIKYKKSLKLLNVSVLNAIAHSGAKNAPERAKAIFEEALQNLKEEDSLQQITATLNGVLFAFAKSEDRKAGTLAEEFLIQVEGMQSGKGEEAIKPDAISYTTVSR